MGFAARLVRVERHDDGLNAWCTHRIAPPAPLAEAVDGYSFYEERTGGFCVRRELPTAEGALLINLGAPVRVVGGDGMALDLAAGEGFVAGAHLRPALSSSGGAQMGVHVHVPLLGVRRLLGVPLGALGDRVVPLAAVAAVSAGGGFAVGGQWMRVGWGSGGGRLF